MFCCGGTERYKVLLANGGIHPPTQASIHQAKQLMSKTLIYGTPSNFTRG
jgi:hypothetical protein